MFEYENSPPSLNHSPSPSDQSHFTSRDTTPVTPVTAAYQLGRRSEKEKDHLRPWFKKSVDTCSINTNLTVDNNLLQPNFDEHSFPQFGASPPPCGMADATGSNIVARPTSTSPRGNQPSTLTFALKSNESGESDTMNGNTAYAYKPTAASAGFSDSSRDDAGTRPISMKGKTNDNKSMRRESIAQSLGMGMSWGGVSVGSWVRDDMMMSGTSPFAFHQSPSYHSSSYLPKLEANFMRDFSCCGLTLPTLHDLLQHYEESHAQKEPIPNDNAQQPPLPDSRAAIAANTAAQIQQEAQQRSQEQQIFQHGGAVRPFSTQNNVARSTGFSNTLQTIPDMDTVDDMEMDDIDETNESTPPSNQFIQASNRTSPSTQYAAQSQVPQLNTNMMQGHQAYRNSTPSTPIASTRNSAAFQNASSTLMANPMQQFQDLQNPYRSTPDSSAPGTPHELDESVMAGIDDMSMANNPLFNGTQNGFGGFGFGMNNDMIDLCIDEPAKRLFQPNQGNSQQFGHNRLGSGQYGANSEIAKRIREQQVLAGLPDTTTNMAPHEEPKPFRCPVIGCEKAYKNQNGLKYHKAHGHNNQRLHENGDGTFSIVNPDTQAPYPGTQGMEKEKPYKCDVCQKRYKNLNGLKYHKTHSPPCNPDLVQNQNQNRPPTAVTPNTVPGQSVNLGNLNTVGLPGDAMMG